MRVEELEEAEDPMDRGTTHRTDRRQWEVECGTGKEVCCMLGNSRNEKSLGGG